MAWVAPGGGRGTRWGRWAKGYFENMQRCTYHYDLVLKLISVLTSKWLKKMHQCTFLFARSLKHTILYILFLSHFQLMIAITESIFNISCIILNAAHAVTQQWHRIWRKPEEVSRDWITTSKCMSARKNSGKYWKRQVKQKHRNRDDLTIGCHEIGNINSLLLIDLNGPAWATYDDIISS